MRKLHDWSGNLRKPLAIFAKKLIIVYGTLLVSEK
jgi:hypothetical protein